MRQTMKRHILSTIALFIFSMGHGLASGPADPQEELLQPGYQLVFIGDSITHGSIGEAVKKGDVYHCLFQVYLSTHLPARDLWTVNAGRSGDNLGGLLHDRLTDQDVYRTLPGVLKKSDVAFIMYGMNDGGSFAYLTPINCRARKRGRNAATPSSSAWAQRSMF